MANRRFVVDTHTLLWFLTDDQRLGKDAGLVFADPMAHLIVPIIVVAEALFLIEKGRVASISESKLLAHLQHDRRFDVVSLDERIIGITLDCKAIPEMHDRQIVATALLVQQAGVDVAILTRDEAIRSANLAPTLW